MKHGFRTVICDFADRKQVLSTPKILQWLFIFHCQLYLLDDSGSTERATRFSSSSWSAITERKERKKCTPRGDDLAYEFWFEGLCKELIANCEPDMPQLEGGVTVKLLLDDVSFHVVV